MPLAPDPLPAPGVSVTLPPGKFPPVPLPPTKLMNPVAPVAELPAVATKDPPPTETPAPAVNWNDVSEGVMTVPERVAPPLMMFGPEVVNPPLNVFSRVQVLAVLRPPGLVKLILVVSTVVGIASPMLNVPAPVGTT